MYAAELLQSGRTYRKNFAIFAGSTFSSATKARAVMPMAIMSSGCWFSTKSNLSCRRSCCPRMRRRGTNLKRSFLISRSISGSRTPTFVSSAYKYNIINAGMENTNDHQSAISEIITLRPHYFKCWNRKYQSAISEIITLKRPHNIYIYSLYQLS